MKTTTAKMTAPRAFHLDRRADSLRAMIVGDEDNDALLTTVEMSKWFGVSIQWFEIGRIRGYGPPFERIAPKTIRYRRSKVLAWLDERCHRRTAEYLRDA